MSEKKYERMIVKSIKIDPALFERASNHASGKKMSFSQFISCLIREKLELGNASPEPELYTKVAEYVNKTYKASRFPTDVTLKVFQHIKKTPELFELYLECVKPNHAALITVHKNIGAMVKNMLNADLTGERCTSCNPEENLIKSYSFLKPGKSKS